MPVTEIQILQIGIVVNLPGKAEGAINKDNSWDMHVNMLAYNCRWLS